MDHITENEEKYKLIRAIKCSIVFMVIYCLLTLLAIYHAADWLLAGVGIIGGIYVIVNAFCIKYKREKLFINGLISALAVLCLGVLVGKNIDLEGVVSLGVAISVLDILSFTKYGKNTVNAKAMSNVHFMSKLIVYGKGKGDILIPTRGIGDYFYNAMWIAGIWNISNQLLAYVGAAFMIFIGTTIEYFIIARLSQKEGYKGFPATVIPFVCVMVWYGVLYLKL